MGSVRVVEDIYSDLVQRIDSDEMTEAFRCFEVLNDTDAKIFTLSRLANEIASTLVWDRGLTFELETVLNLARALARDLELNRVLSLNLAHAHELSLDLARALETIHSLNPALDQRIGRAQQRTAFIVRVLTRLVGAHSPAPDTIDFVGSKTTSPEALLAMIPAFVQALTDFERTISNLKQVTYETPRIRSINMQDTVQIEVENAPMTAEFCEELMKWRRDHARLLTAMDALEGQIENDHLRDTLLKEETQLAASILEKVKPGLNGDERIVAIFRLLKPLEVLVSSPLMFAGV